jgi:hypothetical protein
MYVVVAIAATYVLYVVILAAAVTALFLGDSFLSFTMVK